MDYCKPVLKPLPKFEVSCPHDDFSDGCRRAYMDRLPVTVDGRLLLVAGFTATRHMRLDDRGRQVEFTMCHITFQPLRERLSSSVGICPQTQVIGRQYSKSAPDSPRLV